MTLYSPIFALLLIAGLKIIIPVGKFYNVIIKYRLYIAIAFLATGHCIPTYHAGFWPAFICLPDHPDPACSAISFGPLRLIQEHMESGNMEEAEKVINSIKYPDLLYKPIRSVFYTLKGNMAMMKQDFDGAEKNMKKGPRPGHAHEGSRRRQPIANGHAAMQKNDMRQAESYIRQALRKGLPDKENQAAAYLQMCTIMMNKREFRAAKDFFRKAKALKAYDAADRRPDQTDRKIHLQDTGIGAYFNYESNWVGHITSTPTTAFVLMGP